MNVQKAPSFIEPMKALPVENLPEGDWLYEIKFDGYRALALKEGKDVRLVSRNQKAFDYPRLLDALKLLPAGCFILDGEIAALDEKGRSSFQLLQIFKSSGNVPLVYFAFDLFFFAGKDLREERLSAGVNSWLSCLKKLLRTSGSPVSFAAAKTNCSGLLKNSASRGWSPKDQIHSTKAVGAVVPG
jgi:bifunctional non-homologous end joining protein LigD